MNNQTVELRVLDRIQNGCILVGGLGTFRAGATFKVDTQTAEQLLDVGWCERVNRNILGIERKTA